jgi:hypothetical protein
LNGSPRLLENKNSSLTKKRIVESIAIVCLSEIENTPPWNPDRLEKIRKWATPEALTRLVLNGRKLSYPFRLPCLSRTVVNGKPLSPFRIHEGIHRVAVARELGMTHILAYVEEVYYENV